MGGHDNHLAGLRDLIRPELDFITKKLIIFKIFEENGEFGGRRVPKSQIPARNIKKISEFSTFRPNFFPCGKLSYCHHPNRFRTGILDFQIRP